MDLYYFVAALQYPEIRSKIIKHIALWDKKEAVVKELSGILYYQLIVCLDTRGGTENNESAGRLLGVENPTENIYESLDNLFIEICRELAKNCRTLTGGQISTLKRLGMPEHLAQELEAIKEIHVARISDAERLNERFAASLYEELTHIGLISGAYGTFLYHLGNLYLADEKDREKALKWNGNKAEFAYFCRLFSEYTQSGGIGAPYVREKALCRAFGFDDKQRENSIRPYISDRHQPKTSAKIESAFSVALEKSLRKE